MIEGSNIAALNNSTLNAASGTSEHRGVFLYQSMSGDADNSNCGTGACFTMTGGTYNYTDTYNSSSSATSNCAAFAVAISGGSEQETVARTTYNWSIGIDLLVVGLTPGDHVIHVSNHISEYGDFTYDVTYRIVVNSAVPASD